MLGLRALGIYHARTTAVAVAAAAPTTASVVLSITIIAAIVTSSQCCHCWRSLRIWQVAHGVKCGQVGAAWQSAHNPSLTHARKSTT